MTDEKRKKRRYFETVTRVSPPSDEIKKSASQYQKPKKDKPKTTKFHKREET